MKTSKLFFTLLYACVLYC